MNAGPDRAEDDLSLHQPSSIHRLYDEAMARTAMHDRLPLQRYVAELVAPPSRRQRNELLRARRPESGTRRGGGGRPDVPPRSRSRVARPRWAASGNRDQER